MIYHMCNGGWEVWVHGVSAIIQVRQKELPYLRSE